MENNKDTISKLITDIYSLPVADFSSVSESRIKVKRTIEEEKEIKTIEEVIEPNYLPGNVAISVGVIFFLYNIIFENNFVIALSIGILIIILGFVLRDKVRIKKSIEIIKKVSVPKEIEVYEYLDNSNKDKTRYKVNKVGSLNLYFSVVSVNGDKILISENNSDEKTYLFPILNSPINFSNDYLEIINDLKEIPDILHGNKVYHSLDEITDYGEEIPLIGYENEIFEYIGSVLDSFNSKKTKKFNLSILSDSSFLNYFKTSNELAKHYSAIEFDNFLNGDNGESLDNILNEWKIEFPKKIDQINDIRIFSLKDQLSSEFLLLGQTSHFSGFNFYCPDCNKDISESILKKDYSVQNFENDQSISLSKNTRCYYIPDKNIWRCPVCNLEYLSPIPIHKSLDEILLPTFDKLIEEHKIEREKRNSETRSKELEFRKELKSKIDEINYNSLNQIFSLEDEMERMKAEISGQTEAINYMNKIAFDFRHISTELLLKIQRDTAEIEKRISIETKEVIQMLDDYKNKEMSKYESNMNELSKAKRIDDERRESHMRSTIAAIKENTMVTEKSGQQIVSAVQENTKSVCGQLKKNYALNAAVAKQQGYNVDDYGWFRIDKNLEKSFINLSSSISGKSSVERELELNK